MDQRWNERLSLFPEKVGNDWFVGAFDDFESTSLSRMLMIVWFIVELVPGSSMWTAGEMVGWGWRCGVDCGGSGFGIEIVAMLAVTLLCAWQVEEDDAKEIPLDSG